MKKKQKHEEHENSERWLLTYADLITLLLGLFVVLYSTAQQDTEKFRKAMKAMVKVLNPQEKDDKPGNSKEFAVLLGEGEGKEEKICKDEALEKLKEEIEKDEKNGHGLSASLSEEGLVINLQEKLLFDSGKTDFKEGAIEVLDRVCKYLAKVDNKIKVSGHTDNVPISNYLYPSNWHLSLGRAVKTSEYLIRKKNMDSRKFMIAAYADTMPVDTNATESGREKNRRVEIIVLREKFSPLKKAESGKDLKQEKTASKEKNEKHGA